MSVKETRMLSLLTITLSALAAEPANVEPVDFRIVPIDVECKAPRIIIEMPTGEDGNEIFRLRFPEIISFREEGADERVHQYVDNVYIPSYDAKLSCPYPPEKLPVEWVHGDGKRCYGMSFVNGVKFTAAIERKPDGFEVCYTLTNGTDKALHDISMWTCLILSEAPTFRNDRMERTYVHTARGFECFGDLVDPEAFPKDKFFSFGCSGSVHVPADIENPEVEPNLQQPEWTKYRWRMTRPIDIPLIAETSQDGEIVVATGSKSAHTVWSNVDINCQHSDPPNKICRPGETVSVFQRIYIYRGELEALDELYKRDFGTPGIEQD